MAVIFKTKPVLICDDAGIYHVPAPRWLDKVALVGVGRVPDAGLLVKIDFKDSKGMELFPKAQLVSKDDYDSAPHKRSRWCEV